MAPWQENRLDAAAPGKLRCAEEVGGTDELPIGRPRRGRCDGAAAGEQARYSGAGEASMQRGCCDTAMRQGSFDAPKKWAAQTNSLLAEWAVIHGHLVFIRRSYPC
uniref:Uncharacterized protein n=1 Tax=Oryza meridionalis TaxID=40149 RepID=A0A0E0FDW1_9ORYZ